MTGICTGTSVHNADTREKNKPAGNKIHYVYVILRIRNKFILFILALLPLFFEKDNVSQQILISLLLQLTALAFVLIPALISRHYLRWQFDRKYITLRTGFINRNEISVPFCNIRCISVIRTPLLSVFRAVRLEIRSSDGMKKPEITLYLSHDQANALTAYIMKPKKATDTLIPRPLPFILTAVSRANFAAGLTILAVFIASFGGVVTELSPDRLYSDISETAAYIIPYIPPAVSAVSGLLLLGWTVHFLSICFSDARQVTTVSADNIITVRGLISTNLTCIRKSSTASCFSRQTALTALFGQCSVNLTAEGLNKKSALCALTAYPHAEHSGTFNNLCSMEPCSSISVKVPENSRLIWWLPYGCVSLLIAMLWVREFVSVGMNSSTLSFVLIFLFILSLWKCIIGIIGSGKGCIEFSGQNISMTSMRLFSFFTLKVFMGQISEFRITSTIIQKHRNLCTVSIKAVGSRKMLKCRNLPFDTVNNLSERIK